MKKILTTVLLCCILLLEALSQKTTKYTVANTTTQLHGLNIFSIITDNEGNKWFGTEGGVSKFDGTIWTNYDTTNGLKGYYVNSIVIDAQGNKWFGTDSGVSKFDGTNWTYFSTTNGLISPYVHSIVIDAQGNKWFGTDKGVSKFDGTTWTNYSKSNGLISNYVYSIAIDAQGNKWFGTDAGVSKFDGTNWTNYTKSNGLINNYVYSIAIDAQGNKWFGTEEGISKFDGTNWTNYSTNNGLIYNSILSIAIDAQGNKWFGTAAGVSKFDGANWTNYSKNNGLISNYVYSIVIDTQGNRWFGTDGGVSKFDGTNWNNYSPNGLLSDNVNTIAIDTQGSKWIGTEGGISKFNDTIWTNYTTNNGLINNYVNSIVIDAQGNKWIGTNGGISKFDGVNWTNYTASDGLISNYVNSIAIDTQGNKWFGTNGGVSKFGGTGWTNYSTNNGLESNQVYSIAIDAQGNKWFGTEKGVSEFDGVNWKNYAPAPWYYVFSIAFDAQGNKWFGTSHGISKFDGTHWTYYSPRKNTNSFNSTIAIDANNNKWLNDDECLIKFDDVSWSRYNVVVDSLRKSTILIDKKGNKWCASKYLTKFEDGGAGPLIFNNIQVGYVFIDKNENGHKDANETCLPGEIIMVNNNYTVTQSNGLFYASLNDGINTLLYKSRNNWTLTTDSTKIVNVVNNTNLDTIYFGVKPKNAIEDVSVKITGTASRAGLNAMYWIDYVNHGTNAQAGQLVLNLDSHISLINAIPSPDSIKNNRLVWNFNNLNPQNSSQVQINVTMPNINFLTDTLTTISQIFIENDAVSRNNADTLKQVVVGSYDPNDKSVQPEGVGENKNILTDKELIYTIRFQNTGTDTAYNVNIRDTLSNNMDLSTLLIQASSHPMSFEIKDRNEVIFHFNNIMLPDSNHNVLGSNGFVKYAIKPKAMLADNTVVENVAYVYFDFNPPIKTNTTLNTLTYPKFTNNLKQPVDNFDCEIYPNPVSSILNVRVKSPGAKYFVSISSMSGAEILNKQISENSFTINVNSLSTGAYILKLVSNNKVYYLKFEKQ